MFLIYLMRQDIAGSFFSGITPVQSLALLLFSFIRLSVLLASLPCSFIMGLVLPST
jgi:hypothetical protein